MALARAAGLVHGATRVSVFTGAGISVESGIPDFRSPGGLWSKYDPFTYCNYDVFKSNPELFWRMARELVLDIHVQNGGTKEEALKEGKLIKAQPNAAHMALAELQNMGKKVTVITQNIDGLHKAAGSNKVIELHGTDQTSTCMSCLTQYEQSEVISQWIAQPDDKKFRPISEDDFVPVCKNCGGVLKADVTFFGEALPAGAMFKYCQTYQIFAVSSTGCDVLEQSNAGGSCLLRVHRRGNFLAGCPGESSSRNDSHEIRQAHSLQLGRFRQGERGRVPASTSPPGRQSG